TLVVAPPIDVRPQGSYGCVHHLLPAGRSGLSPLRHGGYLSGTLSGALMPILADVQSNLIPIVGTF
ncbi:hypothetical protein, partial [uncultured Porphyromonas sp.]|uniref:hypothetical protein n=1 Tax=uncultured Porphyromonas sp. TaxID=159274 RepID=UPI00259BB5BE